jgi:integrase
VTRIELAGSVIMGFTRPRKGRDGVVRYQALYDDVRGHRRSAGTFKTEKAADKAWQRAESRMAEGRMGNPARGRQRFRIYVLEEWLPNHQMEARTRENYSYYLHLHILPWFGSMRMTDVMPADVRAWITQLQNEKVSAHVIRYCKTILSAIFTTAMNDVIYLHPVHGVKAPPVAKKSRVITTPEQFDKLYLALPSGTMKLLAETDIESGLRWGELTELRPRDLDFRTGVLTVSRVVVELSPRFHPEGGRFLIKDYPKDQEHRTLKLSAQITAKIQAHARDHDLGPDDLLFAFPATTRPASVRVLADPAALGLTTPNAAGRRYYHGTLSGYSAGKCRCEHCRGAYATYRAQRRASGQDQPRGTRTVDTDGHIPRWWFRTHVWLPAVEAAKIPVSTTMQGLRHAHASWLLAGGADLQVVKERLGHASIVTTQKYLGTLDETDETAIDALTRIRSRSASPARTSRRRSA